MGADLVGVGVLVAFVVSTAVAFVVLYLGRRWDVIDRPDDELKTHTGAPVPLGGVAVMAGFHLGLAAAGSFDPGLLFATLIVFVLGAVDDVRGLSPRLRILVTAIAGVVLVVASDVAKSSISALAGIVLVILLVNAVNLFDGLDALAATIGSIAALALGLLASIVSVSNPWVPAVVVGALGGVLVLNWPPAKLYLGDNGAYVVGVVLAWAVLRTSTDLPTGLAGAALIGLPLIDLAVTVVRRLRRRTPVFAGDRDHTYDRLDRRLHSTVAVVAVMAVLQLSWSAVLLATSWQAGATAAVWVATASGVVILTVAWATA